MLTTILCGALFSFPAAASVSTAAQGSPEVSFEIPGSYVIGRPFLARVTYAAGNEPVALEAWRLGPAAFEVDGKPLGERGEGSVPLLPHSKLIAETDLSSALGNAVGKLSVAVAGGEARSVTVYQQADAGVNFLEMTPEFLKGYLVLLQTNRGDMLLEFLPDVAPKHVQNFLDLAYTGFYDGTLFHRVSPTFMIQGGDPNTKSADKASWGTGRGPRMLEEEFTKNPTKHVRGVLSMARGQSPNSASSQFFVITQDSPFLDRNYSAFGRLVAGEDALDRIAGAEGAKGQDGTVRPSEPQRIDKAIVVRRTAP
jgi:peptidyl-prolyl cis-trans isomerase B (cyclophilin B)